MQVVQSVMSSPLLKHLVVLAAFWGAVALASPLLFRPANEPVYKDCKATKLSKTKTVIVNGQPGKKCLLKKGTNATINIDFIAYESTPTLTAIVTGIVKGIPIHFDTSNACNKSGLKCPIKNGTSYAYTSAISIKKIYPTIQVIVKWELQDSKKTDLLCVVIPCEIVN